MHILAIFDRFLSESVADLRNDFRSIFWNEVEPFPENSRFLPRAF